MANIGLQQIRKDGTVEPALVTVGDDLSIVAQFLAPGKEAYTAAEVIDSLLSLVPETVPEAVQPQPAPPTRVAVSA